MATWLKIDEVLKRGIEREMRSQNLYIELAKNTDSAVTKGALNKLALQEKEHQAVLEKYASGELKDGGLGRRKPINYHIVMYIDQPEVSLDIELSDVYLVAASQENMAYEFYIGLAGVHPPGQIRKLLGELAVQELEHKHVLEFLYAQSTAEPTGES